MVTGGLLKNYNGNNSNERNFNNFITISSKPTKKDSKKGIQNNYFNIDKNKHNDSIDDFTKDLGNVPRKESFLAKYSPKKQRKFNSDFK